MTSAMPIEQVDFKALASTTIGFVHADLSALVRQSALLALQTDSPTISHHHFIEALKTINPSLLRESFSSSNTSWDDIAGMDSIKDRLKQCIEWPLIHADAFTRLGVKPTKGLLLYGPPGCSKTSLVKAIAYSVEYYLMIDPFFLFYCEWSFYL